MQAQTALHACGSDGHSCCTVPDQALAEVCGVGYAVLYRGLQPLL